MVPDSTEDLYSAVSRTAAVSCRPHWFFYWLINMLFCTHTEITAHPVFVQLTFQSTNCSWDLNLQQEIKIAAIIPLKSGLQLQDTHWDVMLYHISGGIIMVRIYTAKQQISVDTLQRMIQIITPHSMWYGHL